MPKVRNNLLNIVEGVDAAAKEALRETADFILLLVRTYAPVDTGRLRDSYEIEEAEGLKLLIGTIVLYAVYQEFGTATQSGTPHLTPAFLQAQGYFQQRVAYHLNALTGRNSVYFTGPRGGTYRHSSSGKKVYV